MGIGLAVVVASDVKVVKGRTEVKVLKWTEVKVVKGRTEVKVLK